MEKQIKEIVKAIKNNYKEQRSIEKTTRLLLVKTFTVKDTTWLQFVAISPIEKCYAFIEIVILKDYLNRNITKVRPQAYVPLIKGFHVMERDLILLLRICNDITKEIN